MPVLKILKDIIQLSELTQAEIARKMGISESALSRKIAGERSFTREEILRLCNLLGQDRELYRKLMKYARY